MNKHVRAAITNKTCTRACPANLDEGNRLIGVLTVLLSNPDITSLMFGHDQWLGTLLTNVGVPGPIVSTIDQLGPATTKVEYIHMFEGTFHELESKASRWGKRSNTDRPPHQP